MIISEEERGMVLLFPKSLAAGMIKLNLAVLKFKREIQRKLAKYCN